MSQTTLVQATCSICGKAYEGVVYDWKEVTGSTKLAAEEHLGYQCKNCGSNVCAACKKHLNFSLWSGWEKTLCPQCGELFGPGQALFRKAVESPTDQTSPPAHKPTPAKMNDDIPTWEQWETDRAVHLDRFKTESKGKGYAIVTGPLVLVGLGGSLVGCAKLFGWVDDGGGLQNLGTIVLSWVPLLGWLGFIALLVWIGGKIEEKRQLRILLNNPSLSKRCNAAYWLSVMDSKGAMLHLESLLNDDTVDPKLREYTEKALAKLKVEAEETQHP